MSVCAVELRSALNFSPPRFLRELPRTRSSMRFGVLAPCAAVGGLASACFGAAAATASSDDGAAPPAGPWNPKINKSPHYESWDIDCRNRSKTGDAWGNITVMSWRASLSPPLSPLRPLPPSRLLGRLGPISPVRLQTSTTRIRSHRRRRFMKAL